MTRHRRLLVVAVTVGIGVATIATASSATPAPGNNGPAVVREVLTGYAETPQALSSPANGQFRMQINDRAQEISWRLSYSDFPTAVQQAHVHFGSPAQSGGISFFLCTNLGNGPAGTQTCPAAPATITGTIMAADVVGPAAQGIGAGEFGEVLQAFRAGLTYVNIHSAAFPGGEIRAQLGHQH